MFLSEIIPHLVCIHYYLGYWDSSLVFYCYLVLLVNGRGLEAFLLLF